MSNDIVGRIGYRSNAVFMSGLLLIRYESAFMPDEGVSMGLVLASVKISRKAIAPITGNKMTAETIASAWTSAIMMVSMIGKVCGGMMVREDGRVRDNVEEELDVVIWRVQAVHCLRLFKRSEYMYRTSLDFSSQLGEAVMGGEVAILPSYCLTSSHSFACLLGSTAQKRNAIACR